MVPTTFVSVGIFLLFIAPGMTYELLRRRTKLPREETAFVEISRVLLAGTLITTFALLLLAGVAKLAPTILPDLPAIFRDGVNYANIHFALVSFGALAELIVAVLLAISFNDWFTVRQARHIHPIDMWHAAAELAVKPGQTACLNVRLKNGSEIIGVYDGASTELDSTKRELSLVAPFHYRGPGEESANEMAHDWHRFVISASQIDYFFISYVTTVQKASKSSRRVRVFTWLVGNSLTWKVALPFLIAGVLTMLVIGNAGFRAWIWPDF